MNQSERLIFRLIRPASHARAEQYPPSLAASIQDAVPSLHPRASSPMLPNPRQIRAVPRVPAWRLLPLAPEARANRPEHLRKARPSVTEPHLVQSPSRFDSNVYGERNQEMIVPK